MKLLPAVPAGPLGAFLTREQATSTAVPAATTNGAPSSR